MEYLLLSFAAGILTVLAPCVFPLLPVILGGSVGGEKKYSPLIVVASLAISVALFSLLLKASTALLHIDPFVWQLLSGSIILIVGIANLFPQLWTALEVKLRLGEISGSLMQSANGKSSVVGSILLGAALGPVFTSCSPTYALIVAVILPQDFAVGLVNLLAYVTGLALIFGLVALGGRTVVNKLQWSTNPNGKLKKILGVVLVVLGIMIIIGLDKRLEATLLDAGYGTTLIQIENNLAP